MIGHITVAILAGTIIAALPRTAYGHTIAKPSKTAPKALENLCSFVDRHTEEDENSYNSYLYQTKILDFAGVSEREYLEEPEIVAAKVNKIWHLMPTCNDPAFSLQHGSIIKYAVNRSFDTFIYDVARNWRVPLNDFSDEDGRTVLDFVDDYIQQNEGNVLEAKLRTYFRLLRLGGAKLRVEIDGVDCRKEGQRRPDARC